MSRISFSSEFFFQLAKSQDAVLTGVIFCMSRFFNFYGHGICSKQSWAHHHLPGELYYVTCTSTYYNESCTGKELRYRA